MHKLECVKCKSAKKQIFYMKWNLTKEKVTKKKYKKMCNCKIMINKCDANVKNVLTKQEKGGIT